MASPDGVSAPPTAPRQEQQSHPHSLLDLGSTLEVDIEALIRAVAGQQQSINDSVEQLEFVSGKLQQICNPLQLDDADSRPAKDTFRRCKGFEALLAVVSSLVFTSPTGAEPGDRKVASLKVLEQTLLVLQLALTGHQGNANHFEARIPGGGWNALEHALLQTDLASLVSNDTEAAVFDRHQLFSALFVACLCNESLSDVFADLDFRSVQLQASAIESPLSPTEKQKSLEQLIEASIQHAKTIAKRRAAINVSVSCNVHIMPIILHYWQSIPRVTSSYQPQRRMLSLIILSATLEVVKSSRHRIFTIGLTSTLASILRSIVLATELGVSTDEASLLRQIYLEIAQYGVAQSKDAVRLFQSALKSQATSELLLEAIQSSRQPRHFFFDLSLSGYASIELPQIKEPFPPDPNKGYTFLTWFKVDNFDDECHTTLFGAFDSAQTCFMLIYVDNQRRQLVLQTSLSQKDPSVRFKSFTFEQGIWYHVAIVHRRSVRDSASRAGLYVNGVLKEQLKCHYPSYARGASSYPASANAALQSKLDRTIVRQAPVQAFVGTPEALSPKLKQGALKLRWSMASAHVVAGILPDDFITVIDKLGPKYFGNFQDCLGSFQTYTGSAALNLQNELLYPGNNGDTTMAKALRSRASKINPERNVLLSISPLAISRNLAVKFHREQVTSYYSISDKDVESFANESVLNAAVPRISDALTRPFGVALLTGGTSSSTSIPFEDAFWRLSGCTAMALKLVQSSSDPKTLLRTVEMFFELVQYSWRNSEAMERGSGFSILAWLLRTKLEPYLGYINSSDDERAGSEFAPSMAMIMKRLLDLTLAFVGFTNSDTRRAMIINPLAYRALLVDCDVWRKSDVATQNDYYQQFIIFGDQSLHHDFNAERLGRMRVIRRLLEALKSEPIHAHTTTHIFSALETLLKCTISADVLRSLSLYITYALNIEDELIQKAVQEPSGANTPVPGSRRMQTPARITSVVADSPKDPPQTVSQKELGSSMLKMLADLLCGDNTGKYARRFSRTITNKWVLFLFAVDDASVISSAMRILACLFTISGPSYVSRFQESTKGFDILARRLCHWWNQGPLWTTLFAVLFGLDLQSLDIEIPFENHYVLHKITSEEHPQIACPQIFPVMIALLRQAMIDTRGLVSEQNGASKSKDVQTDDPGLDVLLSVVELLHSLHSDVPSFHEFTVTSDCLKDFLDVYYASYEFSVWTLSGDPDDTDDKEQRAKTLPIITTDKRPSSSPDQLLHRSSSFVVVQVAEPETLGTVPYDRPLAPRNALANKPDLTQKYPKKIIDLITTMCTDRILFQKEFPGLGLFLKAPAIPENARTFLSSLLVETILTQVEQEANTHIESYLNTVSLINTARFMSQTLEAILEGWLCGIAYSFLKFCATLLLILRRHDIRQNKIVRLCSPSIVQMQYAFRRVIVFYLSNTDTENSGDVAEQILLDLVNWQELLFVQSEEDEQYFCSFCYLVYLRLVDQSEAVRLAALNLLRVLSIERPSSTYLTLADMMSPEYRSVGRDLAIQLRTDAKNVPRWLEAHRTQVDLMFVGQPKLILARRVRQENVEANKTASKRRMKRKERLEERHLEEMAKEHTWTEHEIATGPWIENICSSEVYKQRRAKQDQADNDIFMKSQFSKDEGRLLRTKIIKDEAYSFKWSLDEAEGFERKRLRLIPKTTTSTLTYRPKRANTQHGSSSGGHGSGLDGTDSRSRSISLPVSRTSRARSSSLHTLSSHLESSKEKSTEEEFEIVTETQNAEAEGEDKNRKVMRSLQRGEHVINVYNISRVTGLEACESLLIIGKLSLYLISNYFQRSDGEVVNTWQAPLEERDPYTRIISGTEINANSTDSQKDEEDVRNWPWISIIGVSKRQFLLRNVGLEIFFHDGRSYLLTAHSIAKRDELHDSLVSRIQAVKQTKTVEDAWRMEMLPNSQDTLGTVGARLSSVFNTGVTHPATKQWMKGEISNFQYLMLINTMAGRTFNDLTQYPIFPWVLADYTSEELDLTNPRVYRDLSKPMGCQTIEREQAFRERYNALTDMMDHQTPSFHYGTHYSSAMIVTSYLIRLQPFVRAYLLLQGGTFDHAERLFYSIEKAWLSASRESMTDVRELTPEFFCLPEFLVNVNEYNFGQREGSDEMINNVKLPPWAKGDPNIFIAKQREALESPYVSQNLHNWIDLVFGFKQRGEAAREATNVFHYLSYQGAKDLDSITDPLERRATIGIIHNFGQTPRQVFNRPHDRRGNPPKTRRIDRSIEFLTRIPTPLFKSEEPISSLRFSEKHQRMFYACPGETIMPSDTIITACWGYSDGSLRFSSANNRMLLGLFEQSSQDLISAAVFADSSTLLTASVDTTISVWTVELTNGNIDLQPHGNLFGHMRPVTVLTVSRAVSTVLSADESGRVLLWDLNRLELIRELPSTAKIDCAQISDASGHIVLCSGQTVLVYTLNGHKLLEQIVCNAADDRVFSCAVYDGNGREWVENELIFTGHKHGVVNVWKLVVSSQGEWQLELMRRLQHIDRASGGGRYAAAITSILPGHQHLFTGDHEGHVFEWTCVR